MGGVVSGEARTEDGDDEAVDDAEPAGPPVAAVDLGLLHNQVNDGGHPERCGALPHFARGQISVRFIVSSQKPAWPNIKIVRECRTKVGYSQRRRLQ